MDRDWRRLGKELDERGEREGVNVTVSLNQSKATCFVFQLRTYAIIEFNSGGESPLMVSDHEVYSLGGILRETKTMKSIDKACFGQVNQRVAMKMNLRVASLS